MKKQLIILFTLILSLFLILPVNTVYADATEKEGDATYTFEGDTVTDTNVGDENFDITGIGGAQVDDDPAIDTRSWYQGTSDTTYINFTDTHPEMFFWIYFGAGSTDITFYIYNDDDELVVNFYFHAADSSWYNRDHENTATIFDTPGGGAPYFLRISMNASDDVYFQAYGTGWTNYTDTPRYVRNNYNFSYMKITTGATGVTFNLDNVGYNDNVYGSEEGFDDSEYASICANPISGYINIPNKKYIEHKTESTYSMTVHAVLLPVSYDQIAYMPDENSYDAFINGNYCGHPDYIQPYGSDYALIWDNLNSGAGFIITSEQIVFEFGCSDSVTLGQTYYWYGVGWTGGGTGDTKVHSTTSLFGDGLLSGSYDGWSASWKTTPCWYYDTAGVSQPEPIPPVDVIDTYEDSYAENGTMGWFEFYEWFTECYHRVGDKPYVIYNMTGNGTGESKIYRFDIVKVGDTGSFVYTGLITVTADYKTAYYRIPDYVFEEKGQYYINVYNTTDYGLTYGDRVYTSRNIYVCEASGTGGYDPDGVLPDMSGNPLAPIIGLIVTVFLTLSPMIIAGSIPGNVQVPTAVYMIMGAIGVSISTLFGWFPGWVIFFLVAVGIIAMILMYFIGRSGE